MQKHTLLALGFTFLTGWSSAQIADSTLRSLALQKLTQFGKFMELVAAPGLTMSTKISLEHQLEADFLENNEVRFFQDLNNQFGHVQQIAAHQYFTQLRVLYPNGASLETTDFEASDVFFDPSRDMYYLMMRCKRTFKGLNVMAKKEVSITKVIDYQVKIMEAGQIRIQVLGSHLAEGSINVPIGLDKSVDELKRTNYAALASPSHEYDAIIVHNQTIAEMDMKISNYKEINLVGEERELNQPKTKSQKHDMKLQAKLEQTRIRNEIRKAKMERENLYPYRFNFRIGGGVFLSDSTVNALVETDPKRFLQNWNIKLDLMYKFANLHRDAKGKWERAHAVGLFFNYGKQSGKNVYNLIKSPDSEFKVDTLRGARGFFEAEFGLMLKEQLRLSAGGGLMNYYRLQDGQLAPSTKTYYSMTAGISPRFFNLFELDFNLTGLVVDTRFYARANLNLVLLLRTGKF